MEKEEKMILVMILIHIMMILCKNCDLKLEELEMIIVI